ncbi:MAG: DUF4430 domain-containing protein [Lachnospiraceae bacterium]|nr:DUF4430 domain-containing protein [Lachnospiraceae bacterium]
MRKISKKFIFLLSAILLISFCCGCGAKTIGTHAEEPVVKEITTPSETKKSEETTEQQESTTLATGKDTPEVGKEEYYPKQEENTYEETPQPQPAPEPETNPSYDISITVDAGAYGGIQSSCYLSFSYQPTVYDALCNCGVGFEGSSYYIKSINGLAEKQHGAMSGWLYSVNGYSPMETCGSYYLNSGDSVYWWYQAE